MKNIDLVGPNGWFLEEQRKAYEIDPALVDQSWRNFLSNEALSDSHTVKNGSQTNGVAPVANTASVIKAQKLIDSYRRLGHTQAKLSPLRTGYVEPESQELSFTFHGISDPREAVSTEDFGVITFSDLKVRLETIYASSTGYEYTHLSNPSEIIFLKEKIEKATPSLSNDQRKLVLQKVIESEQLESELHKRFVGAKRFSLEGGDAYMGVMGLLREEAPEYAVKDIVIGMAHRGRLGTLIHICGKPLEQLFLEFQDATFQAQHGFGDVKYHLGASTRYTTAHGKEVSVELIPNPSHLETVNAVVEGVVRGKQDQFNGDRVSVLPVLVHGDAAFTGQGIVYECLNFANVAGYTTGGTIHIVINNQVGFTTTPEESRSSRYCTQVAHMADAPVFHVNGEDLDACARVTLLALEFRKTFKKDVVIDIYCYRKYGHNEGDDPTFTQPKMYEEIKVKKPVSQVYFDNIKASVGEIYDDEVSRFKAKISVAEKNDKAFDLTVIKTQNHEFDTPETKISLPLITKIHDALLTYPKDFNPHPKLMKIIEKRTKAILDDTGIEWGVGEALAFGSLVEEGRYIRLSGQDCERGTFSHRHLSLDDFENRSKYIPINTLSSTGKIDVFNSTLSEYGIMGFEYGVSLSRPDALVLWEGQFGDFANGAQIVIDQYIASAEQKWGLSSALTLLLPHGFEGQGPEHSSARLERYLQACAVNNMSVCYPTSAAQYFHLLRRQALRKVRRPLIVMTPKSLLRLTDAQSKLNEFTSGSFAKVIESKIGKSENVILTYGKIFYDLRKAISETQKAANILRIEELYPFPIEEIKKFLGSSKKEVLWVQEEPQNQGAWSFALEQLVASKISPRFFGRDASSQTACGSSKRHAFEQKTILDKVCSIL